MEDIFRQLENKINVLMQRCEQLHAANLTLKQSKSALMHEKETLLAKNKMAISQIENMVSRLKSIEGEL